MYNFNNLTSQAGPVWIAMGALVLINVFVVMLIIILLGKYPEKMIKILIVITVVTLSGLSVYFFLTA